MTPSFSLRLKITSISVVDIERSTTDIFGRSTTYRKVEGPQQEQDRTQQPAQGPEAGAGATTCGQGHRRSPQQALQDQGCEEGDRHHTHRDLAEPEGRPPHSLQEQEVPAPGLAAEEDPRHPPQTHQEPEIFEDGEGEEEGHRLPAAEICSQGLTTRL